MDFNDGYGSSNLLISFHQHGVHIVVGAKTKCPKKGMDKSKTAGRPQNKNVSWEKKNLMPNPPNLTAPLEALEYF